MTGDEAYEQVAAFLRGLGLRPPPALPAQGLVGEAFLVFEYLEAEQALSVLGLVYRFRAEPRPVVVEALFAEATPANTGGGRLVLGENGALLLQRDVVETASPGTFAVHVEALARASLVWSRDIFARAAEKANS